MRYAGFRAQIAALKVGEVLDSGLRNVAQRFLS
jgi:hypothetical protein